MYSPKLRGSVTLPFHYHQISKTQPLITAEFPKKTANGELIEWPFSSSKAILEYYLVLPVRAYLPWWKSLCSCIYHVHIYVVRQFLTWQLYLIIGFGWRGYATVPFYIRRSCPRMYIHMHIIYMYTVYTYMFLFLFDEIFSVFNCFIGHWKLCKEEHTVYFLSQKSHLPLRLFWCCDQASVELIKSLATRSSSIYANRLVFDSVHYMKGCSISYSKFLLRPSILTISEYSKPASEHCIS